MKNNRSPTPHQKKVLLEIRTFWGEFFYLPYGYEWMLERGMVRRATHEEQNMYYMNLRLKLNGLSNDLMSAANLSEFDTALTIAKEAIQIERELKGIDEDRFRIATLTPEAHALLERIKPAQGVTT